MKEDALPPIPTRDEELAYLKDLEASIGTDPIITRHPKKFSAGPHRLRWKQMTELRREYRKSILKNFCISSILLLPITILYILYIIF